MIWNLRANAIPISRHVNGLMLVERSGKGDLRLWDLSPSLVNSVFSKKVPVLVVARLLLL